MEILSEPHVQEILEMAVANNVTLNLTSVNPPPNLTDVNWVPPTSEEEQQQQNHERKVARQQEREVTKLRLGISLLAYSPGPQDKDGYGDEIKDATHFPSGNPRASTMFSRQPSPVKNKIARHHTKRRKQGLPFEPATVPKDGFPRQRTHYSPKSFRRACYET